MKKIIAIFLLITTALYVLPHGTVFSKSTDITAKCTDTGADDGNETKKDTSKEFVTSHFNLTIEKASPANCIAELPLKPAIIYSAVLTPPPDQL